MFARTPKRRHPVVRPARFERLEARTLLTALPYGAVGQDTAEYMLGNVVATVVFFESDGSIDPSTQNWNPLVRDQQGNPVLDVNGQTISASGPNNIELTKGRVVEGLEWWEDTLVNYYAQMYDDLAPIHSLNFIYDFEYAHNPIQTGYEPIDRVSDDYRFWVNDFLQDVGHQETGWLDTDIRTFNNAQRMKYDADWAFTIFVANDYNDVDGRFKSGGTFNYAFAFSGGRFFVAPSRRPASTFAHETGHIFYAMDEYTGAGTYTSRRGYYNTQNLNASDNPDPTYVMQTSIMKSGTVLEQAWLEHTSSTSSLAMIGWQDSDHDGVFDVLDVPLSLAGSGYYDAANQVYRFAGHSAVQTLVNRNSAGRRNDITINEVSQAVYSLDGGLTWIVAETYDGDEVEVNLAIPLQAGQEILIRTQAVDALSGRVVVTSEDIFWGTTEFPTSVAGAGIQGHVWYDKDSDGSWEAGERGIPGWTMQLVDESGQPIQLSQQLQADLYEPYALLGTMLDGVTLTAVGYDVKDGRVGAVGVSSSTPGAKNLGTVRVGVGDTWVRQWTADSRTLRIDLQNPTTTISIDAIAPSEGGYGRLEAYDANGNLLGRTTTSFLSGTAVERMTLSVAGPQIAYAIARSTYESSIELNNLRVGPVSTVATDARGAYKLPALPQGTYHVQAVPSDSWIVAEPLAGVHEVHVGADGKMVWQLPAPSPGDFSGHPSPTAPPWRNLFDPLDVNGDGSLSPLDALLVINELNRVGSHALAPPAAGQFPPPYLDVSGDNNVTPLDALWVINALNSSSTQSSSLALSEGSDGSGDDPGTVAEGEWALMSADKSRAVLGSDSVLLRWSAPDVPVGGSLPVGTLSEVVRRRAVEDALRLFAEDVAQVRQTLGELETPWWSVAKRG
ncbi:MAG: dockerin type I domain-containing protein [Pirellulaceae bacterium]